MLSITKIHDEAGTLDHLQKMSFKQYKAEILKQELDIKPLKKKTKRDNLGFKRRHSIDFIMLKGKLLEYVLAPPKY